MAKTILDFEKGDTSPLKDISDKLQDILDKFGAVGQAWKQTSADMSKANTDNANKLQTVIDKVGDVGQAYKKTSDGINVQGKSNVDQTNKLAQSIDAIAVASKSMDKVVIGGAYKNYLKQIQDQLGLTGNQLVEYIQNAKKAAQASIISAGSDEEAKQLTLSVQVMNDTLKSLGVTEDATGTKTTTLRQRIKEVKDQLVAMADAGLEGTPAFVALQEKAGELNKQFTELNKTVTGLGSDTRNINGLISLASGVAGGYAIAQGAAALFGDQNNEVAQALLKVNAAMSILQGLQQVQQILQKDSGASILLNTLFRKQNTEAIAAQTEAMEVQNQVENGAEISTTTQTATGPVQAVKNVVQSAPVDESAAANTAAITKNTAVVNAAAAAEKGKAIATDISTASTNAQTVSVEGNTVVTGAGTKAIEENTIVKGAGVVATDADIISTNADTGAKVAQTIATEGATAATAEFTAALLANPVTAVVVGVLALVTAIGVLNSNTESAIKLQDEMNNALEEATTGLDADTKSIQNYTKVVIAQAQLRGASAVEISKIQGDANLKELANIKAESDALGEQYNKEIDIFNQVYAYGGKIDKETLDAHAKLLDQKNKLDADYAEKSKALQEEILQHQKLINDENFKSYNAYVQTQVAAQIAGTDAERQAQIASIKQIAAARESDANFQALTDGEKALARANDEKQIQSLQLQNYQHYLKGRTAAVDAEIAIQKAHQAISDADAIASINKITDLQIASIKKQRDETLANPALNAGEQQKAIDEANAAIVEAEKKKQQDILSVQKAELTLQLAAVEKGSYDEYVYNLALIENSRQAEIAAAGKNKDLIKAIDGKYRKEKQDADLAFNVVQLNNEISRDNAALAQFGISEQDKLTLTIKRLNDQQAVEIEQANGNAAKIAEIDAKYDQQRRDAVKASIEAQLQLELNALAVYGQKAKTLNELILNNATSPSTSKSTANDELQKAALAAIEVQKAADKEEFDNKVITYKEYLVKLEDLKNQEDVINQTHADNELKIFKDTQDKKLALLQTSINILQAGINTMDTGGLQTGLTQALGLFTQIGTAINSNAAAQKAADLETDPAKKAALQSAADQQQLENKQKIISAGIMATQATLNQVFADSSAQRQQQMNDDLQALEDQKNAELDNANLTAKQKDEINARYAAKEKAVRLAEWKAEQEAKKEQAIINGALAITNIIATVPKFDFGVSTAIMIGAAVAATALQVAAIDKVKPPKFRHGKVDIQGPGTSTSDSIHAMISKGETVIKAESTAKWKDALVAINNDHFEDYLSQKFKSFVFPHVPDNIPMPTRKTPEIDYDRLAVSVAKETAKVMKGIIPAPKSTHVNIDKNGIHTIVEEANSRTEWKNKRFSME